MSYTPIPVVPARRTLINRAISDGKRLGLSTSFVEGAAKRFNAIGAGWFAPKRMWSFRADQGCAKITQFLTQDFGSSGEYDLDAASETIQAAISHPESDYFTALLDVQILPIESGGYAISSVFDVFVVDAMRSLSGKFHKFAAAWEVQRSLEQIQQALQTIAGVSFDFIFLHERPVILEELVAPPKSEVPITVPAASPVFQTGVSVVDDDGAGSGFLSTIGSEMTLLPVDETALAKAGTDCGLYDYQIAGVRHLLECSGRLLADDMGLGKSRQAVVAARLAAGESRILILCPASLRINWEREIQAVFPGDVIGMVGEDRMTTLYGCRWIIANYERLGGLVREAGLQFEVMAIDEAHYLKEHEAGRTRNAFIMAERIHRKFLLTGTPLLSREVELHTLLRLSGHPLGKLPLADFRKRYAGGQEQRAALADQLRGWMLRRRKDVLKNLGIKTRQVRYISPAEGMSTYQTILNDMKLTIMPKIVKLRQALEALKFDFMVETVQSLNPDDKVIIFCEYMQTVGALKDTFEANNIGCVSLVGADSGPKRQKAIDAFQQDPTVRVFIGTTSAAGVGITLTAANYVMFSSLPWTPALMRQAEDRAYRNGQKRDVIVIVPLIPDTIDEQIYALLESKTELEHEVVEVVRAHLALH